MGILGQAIHDGEDDALAMYLGKAFHEIHGDVRPHQRWDVEWL